ncbi:nuclear transport factor 2 family protein [Altererythrobacter sp. MF3-039]|uniref:nuclear transport factor 2 family protein n=1 Tax=Altererythrobacter sp. MF3-039 TaxID=3252901 RepID=UPI00390C968A
MLNATDKLAILEVLAAANRTADEKDVEGHANYYTDGGVIEGDMQASGDASQFRNDLKDIFDGEPGLKRHVGTSHIFEEDGDRVVVDSLLLVYEGDDAPTVVATADITDELVRDDGSWKIARHKVLMDPGTKKAMAQAREEA